MLQRAGLLESRRYGKWTYYRRNEEMLRRLAVYIREEL
jgi:DNA-binding transcriptional ArsR family regulator